MPVAPVPGTPRTLMSLNVITGVVAPIAELSGVPPLEGRPQYLAGTGEILHLDSDFRTIRSQSLATGTSRVVATFPGEAEVDAFLASPDGAKIAFVLAERYASGRACMARPTGSVTAVDAIARLCEIRLLTLATGEQQVLATRGGQGASVPALVDWSPDGRFLLFADGRPQILDTVSGEVKPLLAPNVRLDWDRTASWSPDGTFIVLPTRSTRFEWRQWTGVR